MLLKAASKRRRSKAQVEHDRQAERDKEAELAEKTNQIGQLTGELNRAKAMDENGEKAFLVLHQLVEAGKAQFNEAGEFELIAGN